jgi:hypothetical protein
MDAKCQGSVDNCQIKSKLSHMMEAPVFLGGRYGEDLGGGVKRYTKSFRRSAPVMGVLVV